MEGWDKCLLNAKQTRNVRSTAEDLDQAIKEAQASKRLTKTAKEEAEVQKAKCRRQLEALKGLLVKKEGGMQLRAAKKLLREAAEVAKAAKDETKELRQLRRKAASRASKAR